MVDVKLEMTVTVKFSFIVTNVDEDSIEAFVVLFDDTNVGKLLVDDVEDDVMIVEVVCNLFGDVVESGFTGSKVKFCLSDEL